MNIPKDYISFSNLEEQQKKYEEWGFKSRKKKQLKTLYYKGIFTDKSVNNPEECKIIGYYNDIELLIELKDSKSKLIVDRRYLAQMQSKIFFTNQDNEDDKNENRYINNDMNTPKRIRKNKGKSIIDFPKEYVVIDLETTGLSPEYDKIIEIGAIKIQNEKVIGTFQKLVNPGEKIDEFVQQLTGITNDMIADAPYIDDVLPQFADFVENSIILAHNANFDVNFIYDEYDKILNKSFTNDFIDTIRIARKLYPKLSHHRLIDIVKHLGIEGSGFHRALSDCEYTYKCFECMKKVIQDNYDNFEEFKKLYLGNKYNSNNKYKDHKIDIKKLVSDNNEFDETHPLYQKVCVFTGILEKYTRQEAAQIVVNLGGSCGNSITKKTNFLILGNNDYVSTIKNGKSNKQIKAEEYKLKGQDIEIISESVFYDLINND